MHSTIRTYLEYFTVPNGYGPVGLRWAWNGEALATDDGTFRFSRQIADFLEGFAANRPVPHFAHVLECLDLLSSQPPAACADPERFKLLAATFRQLGGPMRNAGALFAHLCGDIPPADHVPPGGGKSLAHWLTHSPSLGFLHPAGPGNPEVPALAAHAFHDRVAIRLRAMTDFEVRHWLRNGIAPQDLSANSIAEPLDQKPPSMGEFLDAAVADRTRLGQAVALVRHFVSALTLPPRRQVPPQLPIGGYADVTSRGDPGQLLPSQFAIDPDEFVRRFAENELLFFRREDPHERRLDHLALVVDQGVLTWGPVRLALGAAVLAFGELAAKRERGFSVRCSSSPSERFTPPVGDAKHFGEVLEASDLAPHPAQALAEEVLDQSTAERDIVLLTQPRTLREEEVQRLSKSLPKKCRLFALTATEEGAIEMVRMRDGGTAPISRFRVNFVSPARQAKPAIDGLLYVPWSGDVEPIPYPFRFGLTNRVVDLAFDTGGARLIATTVGGFIFVWALADGSVEVVPRGGNEGQVVKDVQAILEMENGFVVCGRMGSTIVAVHYDWPARTAVLHTLFADAENVETAWHGFPHLHSVVAKAGPVFRAIDLSTGIRYPDPLSSRPTSSRARLAVDTARHKMLPAPQVPVVKVDHGQSLKPPYVIHDSATGQIRTVRLGSDTIFTPTSDGRPRLKGPTVVTAQIARETLALTAHATFPSWTLHDLENDGATIVELPRPHGAHLAKLSQDGRIFARQTDSCEITVTDARDGTTLLTTLPGRCHSNLDVRLGYRCLGIGIGTRSVMVDWNSGPMKVHEMTSPKYEFGKQATNKLYRGNGIFAPLTGRFVGTYRFTSWEIGLDGFGQITIVREGNVACMLIYRRGKLAAWTTDGVRFGPAELTGGPETPGALEQLGEVLRQTTR
jgi:hypothetical protein